MVLQVSGSFPIAEVGGGFAGAKRRDQVKRDEGADRLRLHSVQERAAEVESEKKTDAQCATGGHK